jgi:ribonuclease Z
MKPAFHHKLLNGPFGDPCLQVRIIRENRSFLFDLGDIHALSPATLNRVTEVFVTHTHIDHFIGFDILLRASLRRETPLAIYGPPGIIRNVQGRLAGYTWNLIVHYPLRITVFEYSGRFLTRVEFSAEARFGKQAVRRIPCEGLLLEDSALTVRASVLDHGVPCLAYALEEKLQVNIDKDRLMRKGLSVGPWLTEFKKNVKAGRTGGFLQVNGKRFRMRDLLDIARIARGQKICYATDIGMSSRNRARLRALAENADVLYCEAYFMEKDRALGAERYHLTARECGRIAHLAGVRHLHPMHFSPRYHGQTEALLREVGEEFGGAVSG